MFTGSYPVTIDEKGRFAIPARFRAELMADAQGQLSISRIGSRLKLYPQRVFEALANQILNDTANTADRELLLNRFVGASIRLEMDAQGRLLVPAELRAKIIGEAMLVAQVDRFVLVSAADWAAYQAETEEQFLAAAAARGL